MIIVKIYTKKGDKGQTRMLFGDAVSKDDLAPDAYGSVDELVAALGLIRASTQLPIEVQETVLRIQRELFIVGAELATTIVVFAPGLPGTPVVVTPVVYSEPPE